MPPAAPAAPAAVATTFSPRMHQLQCACVRQHGLSALLAQGGGVGREAGHQQQQRQQRQQLRRRCLFWCIPVLVCGGWEGQPVRQHALPLLRDAPSIWHARMVLPCMFCPAATHTLFHPPPALTPAAAVQLPVDHAQPRCTRGQRFECCERSRQPLARPRGISVGAAGVTSRCD
jgi:hypothetical protein